MSGGPSRRTPREGPAKRPVFVQESNVDEWGPSRRTLREGPAKRPVFVQEGTVDEWCGGWDIMDFCTNPTR